MPAKAGIQVCCSRVRPRQTASRRVECQRRLFGEPSQVVDGVRPIAVAAGAELVAPKLPVVYTPGAPEGVRVLRPLQAAACTYRIAFGPRAGQKVLTLQGAMPRDTDFKQTLCADIDGFSLHAAVRCDADDR